MKNDYSYPEDKYLLIGKVIKGQGLKGEVKVFCFSGQPENARSYKTLSLVDLKGNISAPLKITGSRVQKKLAIIKFEKINSRSEADNLIHSGVLLESNNLPELLEKEYYWKDFIGLAVTTIDNVEIGTVENLFSNGAQDILVVTNESNEYFIPITQDILLQHNKEGLVINPPPGLLDINSGDE